MVQFKLYTIGQIRFSTIHTWHEVVQHTVQCHSPHIQHSSQHRHSLPPQQHQSQYSAQIKSTTGISTRTTKHDVCNHIVIVALSYQCILMVIHSFTVTSNWPWPLRCRWTAHSVHNIISSHCTMVRTMHTTLAQLQPQLFYSLYILTSPWMDCSNWVAVQWPMLPASSNWASYTSKRRTAVPNIVCRCPEYR